MKKFVLLLLPVAIAAGALSCEKHPLPGEPPAPATREVHGATATSPVTGEQHHGGKVSTSQEARDDGAQPAQQPGATEAGKPAEPRKFFPESSEKK